MTEPAARAAASGRARMAIGRPTGEPGTVHPGCGTTHSGVAEAPEGMAVAGGSGRSTLDARRPTGQTGAMACPSLSLRGASTIAAPSTVVGVLPAGATTATESRFAAERPDRDPRGAAGVARIAAASAALCLVLAAGGCSWSGEHPVALATPVDPPAAAPMAVVPEVRTVRRTARSAGDEGASGPIAGTPTPSQIFDFHPPGSGADGWRQPFLIDPNDGPLAGEVRKSAAELKAYLAAQTSDPKGGLKVAVPRRCGETDVATRKPGCSGPAVRSLAAVPSGSPDHP